MRVAARGATEVYEELKFIIDRGGGTDDDELLQQTLEKVRRLAIFGYASGKSIDSDAKELTTRHIRLPGSVQFIGDEADQGVERQMFAHRRQILRIERQQGLQPLQRIENHKTRHAEGQHGNGIDQPMLIFPLVHATDGIK